MHPCVASLHYITSLPGWWFISKSIDTNNTGSKDVKKVNLIIAQRVYMFRDILVRIFPHSDWIRRDTEYLSVFSPNVGKHGPEYLQKWTLFTLLICTMSAQNQNFTDIYVKIRNQLEIRTLDASATLFFKNILRKWVSSKNNHSPVNI